MCVVEQSKHSKESQGFLEEVAQIYECRHTHTGGVVASFYPILYSAAGTVSCTSYWVSLGSEFSLRKNTLQFSSLQS